MKKLATILAALLIAALQVSSQGGGSVQERYVSTYSQLAVDEMYRSGVPASITMAQAMLESGSGTSSLAMLGNNHFGIKCGPAWQGRSMKADDDRPGECFRVYDSPEESFRDHSDFLRYQDRYKFLFDLEPTDYKSWALGLRKAGYATDPEYPAKLITIIEKFKLYDLDFALVEAGDGEAVPPVLPESPNSIESARPYTGTTPAEQYRFSMSRELLSRNGVPFVVAAEGETYKSIARANHLFLFEILRFNELKGKPQLVPGTVVYLQPKKRYAAPGLEKYIVGEDGESFHAICQRFAVKESSIRRLNGMSPSYQLRSGDTILLRKQK